MRSMFNSAPFSKFDLGRHVLGQAQCPPGTIPLLQNGKIVCVEGYAPGSMMSTAEPNPQMLVNSVLDTKTMAQAVPAAVPVPGGISSQTLVTVGAVALGIGILVALFKK